MQKRTGFTVGIGDSDAEIARRVKSFLREQGADGLEVVQTKRQRQASLLHIPGKKKTTGFPGVSMRTRGVKTRIVGRKSDKSAEVEAPSAASRLESALKKARARGATRVAEILAQPEMLTGEDFGRQIGISRQAVDKRRNAGDVIGLEGPSRGVRYPEWQITAEGQMLLGVREVLKLTGGEPWTAYRVLKEEFPDGSGDRIYQKLQKGEIEAVHAHVEAVMAGAVT